MKVRTLLLVVALATAALRAFAQSNATASATLHIISPKAGEKISANFVTVRWELLNPGTSASSSPNYQIRLDGQDPVGTSDNEFTFSGLAAGRHTLELQLVDANGTPINGAHAETTFTVVNPTPRPADTVPDHTDIVRQTSLRRHGGDGMVISRI